MSRPTIKADLIKAANEQSDNLWKLIDSMTEEEQNATFNFGDDFLQKQKEAHWTRDKNLRDVLVHLSTPYEQSKKMLQESHIKVMAMIEPFTNDELFAKKHFSWTGTSTLGSYCVSATSSHFDWAMKKIKKHIKSYRGALD